MSVIPQTFKCDGCGKMRIEDANHWRTLSLVGAEIHILDGLAEYGLHACGDACASKLFSRWLAKGVLSE